MRTEHERDLAEARAQAQMAAMLAQSNAAGGGGAPRAVAAAPVKKKPVTKLRAVDEDAVVSRLGSNGTGKKRTASFQGLDDGELVGQ
ncbi:hypothetical protein ACFQT0_27845 [Hymenobacter humi]|uniref:Uncharacterized protein n=1 Tax=Hymenobacter humi TaxID=1411620 RepID=A0ABW2UD15_9BACT